MMDGAGKVIVIGAGIGGLAAAVRLAAAGRQVTLVEAAEGPGGKMRALPSSAGPVDAGPTVMTMRGVFDDLFAAAGARLEDHVALVRETVLARHFWADGSRLDLHADPEESAAALCAFAGTRAEAEFRAFSARAARLFAAFDAPMMQSAAPSLRELALTVLRQPRLALAMAPGLTLARLLARAFTDPRLRQLFGRYATYVGGSPYQSPALLALVWQAEAAGVWRVEGGMHRLAAALAELARASGARLLFGTPVAEILTWDGAAIGVRLEDGRRLAADRVVFNGDPAALRQGLLGGALREAVPGAAVTPRSLSAHVWSFAATLPAGGPQLAHHNVFFGRDPRAEFADLAAGRMPADPTLYVCAQDRGAGAAPAGGPERFEIILNAAPLCPGATEPPTDEETARCRNLVFSTLAGHGLTFAPEPPDAALTTPAGFAALFPGSAGALYGPSPHGMTASLRKPRARSRVPGLYLAGGGVHPGAGIPMAALSGRHAAEAILNGPTSTWRFRRTATPGGMSTGSATMAAAPSRSSGS